jgi:hypothetical protein
MLIIIFPQNNEVTLPLTSNYFSKKLKVGTAIAHINPSTAITNFKVAVYSDLNFFT